MMSPDLAPSAIAPAARHSRARHAALVACTGVAVVGTLLAQTQERRPARVPGAAAKASSHWEDYGGGPDSSKFVDLTQITPKNVAALTVAWTYPVGDNNVYQFNPIVVGTTMYVLAKNQSLVALDATTGKELWIHAGLRGIARRGINYWESPDGRERRLIFQINNNLQAIDAATGKSILTFGNDGLVDLREGVGRDPALVGRVQSGTPGKITRTCCCSAPRPAKVTCRRRARCARSTSSPARWCGRSTPCRTPARRATRRGPRTPGSTSAAPTPGASSRSTRAAASPTSRPARRPTTTTAPIASAATSTRTR